MSEFQDGATYTQIKDYVLEHSGLKVSNLYISQIKAENVGLGLVGKIRWRVKGIQSLYLTED